SFESGRINLYRWTWAAAFVTWAALGLAIAMLVARAAGRSSRVHPAAALGPLALLAVAALLATAILFVSGTDDHDGLSPTFAAEKRIAAAVLRRIDRRHPVLVVSQGSAANLAVGPYVIARLVEAGV